MANRIVGSIELMALLLVVNVLLLLMCCNPATVWAVTCPCYNGKQASAFSCECSCYGDYLPPTCTFTAADQKVKVMFSLNATADSFIAELFVNAVAFAANTNVTFASAKHIAKFNATTCAVVLSGEGVQRLLTSVAYRDPWVVEYAVVGAYVVTPSLSVASSSSTGLQFDKVLYDGGSFIITVNSILWFVLGAVAVLLIVGTELTFSTNEEAFLAQHSLKHRRSSRRLKRVSSKSSFRDEVTGEDIIVTAEKQVSINLNEHRRPAPPPTMSLPMQILDDFVDSDDELPTSAGGARGGQTSHGSSSGGGAKYSLGKRVEGSRQTSSNASPQSSPKSSRSRQR